MTGDSQPRQLVAKIVVIGGGVSGLAAAKQLRHHNPVVFEASDSIGGVWRSCCYESTKLQSVRRDYEFSDFPWPRNSRDAADYPSHLEILDYLESYASHFDLLKLFRFNSKVVDLRFVGKPEEADYGSFLPGRPVWELAVKMPHSDHIQWYGFEFVVMCIGKYGDVAKVPDQFGINNNKNNNNNNKLSGVDEVFKGKVLHSMDYCKLEKGAARELVRGKKVTVVGYKKSAIDLAMECALSNQGEEGQACTILVRSVHWTVPHYRVWGLPFYLFYSTRASQFLHHRPNQSFLRALLCHLTSPIRRGVSKFIESYLLWKLPLEKYGLKPDHPFEEDYASCQMAIIPQGFFAEADKGKITFKRSSKWWFCKEGLQLDDGTKLEADVVILATGYDGVKKLSNIIPQPFRSLLQYPSGIMPLYRGTIHPLIPNMSFIGYVESVSNLHSSELRSIWMARLIDGKFKLPTVEKMLEQTSRDVEVMRKVTRFYKKKPCISTYSINHSDEICKEMGWNPWRKKSWWAEAFSPYGSQDYAQEKQ